MAQLGLGLQGSPDGGLAAIVVASQRGHGLASGIALGDGSALARIEGRGPAELRALALGAGDACFASRADQASFELADARHDGDDQAAHVGGGVAPCFAKGDEAAPCAARSPRMLCKSRLDRARRSSLQTTTTSPGRGPSSAWQTLGAHSRFA